MVESNEECEFFEPNPWNPRKCKNCQRWHGAAGSVPPSSSLSPSTNRRSSISLPAAPMTPASPFTTSNMKQYESSSTSASPAVNTEGACTNFQSQTWKPHVCMHCFKTRGTHPPSAFNIVNDFVSFVSSFTPPPLPTHSSFDSIAADITHSLPSLHFPPSPYSPSTSDIPEEAPFSGTCTTDADEDEDDPFKGWEELTDGEEDEFQLEIKTTTTIVNSSKGSIGISTTIDSLNYVPSPRSRQSPSVKQFNKWEEQEDDWDHGVEVNFDHHTLVDHSYVNNKIMELNSVKQEADRKKEDLETNPTLATALFEILDAKRKQIQMAFEKDKINIQDHSQLLESLDSIRTMITSSSNICTF